MATSTQKKFAISISNLNRLLKDIRKKFLSPDSFDGSPKNTALFLKAISDFCSESAKFIANHIKIELEGQEDDKNPLQIKGNSKKKRSQSKKYLDPILTATKDLFDLINSWNLTDSESKDWEISKKIRLCEGIYTFIKNVMVKMEKLAELYESASSPTDVTSFFAVLKSKTVLNELKKTAEYLKEIINYAKDYYKRYCIAIYNLAETYKKINHKLENTLYYYKETFYASDFDAQKNLKFNELLKRLSIKSKLILPEYPSNTTLKEIEKVNKKNLKNEKDKLIEINKKLANELQRKKSEYRNNIREVIQNISGLKPEKIYTCNIVKPFKTIMHNGGVDSECTVEHLNDYMNLKPAFEKKCEQLSKQEQEQLKKFIAKEITAGNRSVLDLKIAIWNYTP